MNLIIKAAQFAYRAHYGQFRKHTKHPYITHPARIANRVMLHPMATEESVAAAWLHDTIEDCNIKEEEIFDEFGGTVCQIVTELTNVYTTVNYPLLNRAKRKELELERLKTIHPVSKLIKMFDRIDNLNEMTGADETWVRKYQEESRNLLEVLRGVDENIEKELEQCILSLK